MEAHIDDETEVNMSKLQKTNRKPVRAPTADKAPFPIRGTQEWDDREMLRTDAPNRRALGPIPKGKAHGEG